ncbi:MAG: ATP-dependent DNA ligase [Candidatus Competibacteraceae bacterium]|nr:ATP-dependent DNA ligase [Candidatus Competibacteraceae bacterium]
MKPLLACNAPSNLNSLPYPLLASVKLDGIRCIIKDGVAFSRTLRPIRNHYIQSLLGRPEFNGLDGELVVGHPAASDCMRKTNSGVMSFEGEPDFKYFVFDIWNRPGVQYKDALEPLLKLANHPNIEVLKQYTAKTTNEVETIERIALDDGHEGIILRRPDGTYKYGRSTVKEGFLYKLKRYLQSEAVVIGVEPYQTNNNAAELDALGYTKRSSAKAGKVDLDLLGALKVRGRFQESTDVTFNIGTGFTFYERELLWKQRESLLGRIVTYKFFPVGSKDKPRHPVFVSFRSEDDL